LRGELAEVLRSRLHEMQSQHLVAEGEEDESDRMINRAIQETLKIERIVPVDENRKPIKE
jgi:hypothetical protein